uniref:uncharacterized protein LOC114584940 isoform X2 n=1 Tax=Podarcis muralis TaxID=64176 RepID=UPI00109F5D37|nr:uncharacterized protein LOC114584940 isoform X2 [Podarcis muralis]
MARRRSRGAQAERRVTFAAGARGAERSADPSAAPPPPPQQLQQHARPAPRPGSWGREEEEQRRPQGGALWAAAARRTPWAAPTVRPGHRASLAACSASELPAPRRARRPSCPAPAKRRLRHRLLLSPRSWEASRGPQRPPSRARVGKETGAAPDSWNGHSGAGGLDGEGTWLAGWFVFPAGKMLLQSRVPSEGRPIVGLNGPHSQPFSPDHDPHQPCFMPPLNVSIWLGRP